MISKVWYILFKSISWHDSAMCLQSWHQIPRKIFRLVRLRFRLSFFPGSHHLPWQTYWNTCTWVNSKTEHKNADIKTWTYQLKTMSNTIKFNQTQRQHNIKFHISSNKTQDMHTTTQTWQVPQSSQSRTTSTFLHDVSLRSVSNSKFWMPSRTLLSPSSLRDIWQQNEP